MGHPLSREVLFWIWSSNYQLECIVAAVAVSAHRLAALVKISWQNITTEWMTHIVYNVYVVFFTSTPWSPASFLRSRSRACCREHIPGRACWQIRQCPVPSWVHSHSCTALLRRSGSSPSGPATRSLGQGSLSANQISRNLWSFQTSLNCGPSTG